ncbi:nitroreductase family protein [Terrisporobacter vanillatitrophus]|uniref:nitroreductase family protein n=1 Tax=Terrisporobacter vanillatitrophus TaxID=3058402 RepID=UPI00336685FE
MDYKKLILNRKSVRDFKDTSIDTKYFKEIENYIENSKKLLPEIKVEIKMYDFKDFYENINEIAGYNGYLIQAPNYIIILSDVKEGYIENSGYIGERLILKASAMGIDSCWITFKDNKSIKEKLNISSDKEVTAIIALGYEDDRNSKKKSTSDRLGVEEIVFMDEWGNNASVTELEERSLLDAFSYARMAPSSLNRQPWRFIIHGGKVILAVKTGDFSSDYEGSIDTGIAMLYFSLIIDTTMFDSKWYVGSLNKDYKIPDDYKIVGYCSI